MTIEVCQAFCDSNNYGFAGVEFGDECYCDYSIQFPSALANATDCNVPCAANVNETCGGASRINIFSNGRALPTIPADVTDSTNATWAYNGCFTDDSVGNRTLALHLEPTSGVVTPQTCVDTCSAANQTIAGVEFGDECWCGTVIQNNASVVADAECSQACTADPSFFCGAADRLNVWQIQPKGNTTV
ncbi:hypothetical protein H0H92_002250 [Tricholoma furcatifolium]|nr:hypothetical protein H0H92_002250 [Tricholoma furcatifolium]